MYYFSLGGRISGEGAETWGIHYEAKARSDRIEDKLILSLRLDPDQFTLKAIQQIAIDGIHHVRPLDVLDSLGLGSP